MSEYGKTVLGRYLVPVLTPPTRRDLSRLEIRKNYALRENLEVKLSTPRINSKGYIATLCDRKTVNCPLVDKTYKTFIDMHIMLIAVKRFFRSRYFIPKLKDCLDLVARCIYIPNERVRIILSIYDRRTWTPDASKPRINPRDFELKHKTGLLKLISNGISCFQRLISYLLSVPKNVARDNTFNREVSDIVNEIVNSFTLTSKLSRYFLIN